MRIIRKDTISIGIAIIALMLFIDFVVIPPMSVAKLEPQANEFFRTAWYWEWENVNLSKIEDDVRNFMSETYPSKILDYHWIYHDVQNATQLRVYEITFVPSVANDVLPELIIVNFIVIICLAVAVYSCMYESKITSLENEHGN